MKQDKGELKLMEEEKYFDYTMMPGKKLAKNKAFNDQYYRDLIVKYLEQYGSAKKRDVRELLWDKLPEVMDDKQKESKVKNLLSQMRRTGIITTDSENQQRSSWILVKNLNK